jgi:hypothetical protein
MLTCYFKFASTLCSTLAIFMTLANKPSLRALTTQSRSGFQFKIDLDMPHFIRKDNIFEVIFEND